MTVPVLTAVGDPRWEADLVAGLARGDDVHVVRRCVDLADLLAAAAAGLARAVLLSADLRRLDRDALTRLAVAGVAVIGVVAPGDEDAERRLRQLGVAHVLPANAPAADVAAAVVVAVSAAATGARHDYADPSAVLPDAPAPIPGPPPEIAPGAGRVISVWGATGAPGRTTVSIGLASELAALGQPTLLIDADVYGGVCAQMLGLLDEAPGLAAACRLANSGSLDLPALAELAVQVRPDLRALTGIARAERWPELRPTALEVVLGLARRLAAFVVVDCGFALERDEELSYDTLAPRRNGATLTALAGADVVVAVAAADPVGLQRFVRGLGDLADAVPDVAPLTVVNRVRPAVVGGGDAEAEIRAALGRYAGVTDLRFVPLDMAACDAALAVGRTLAEVAPASPARLALQAIAAGLAGAQVSRRRRRLSLRRGQRAAS